MGFGNWIGNPGFGGFSDWGGDIRIPGELLGCLRVRVLSLGPVFIYFHVSITDFTKLFWSGDAYFGNQDSSYISYLHFSIPYFPCSDLVRLA